MYPDGAISMIHFRLAVALILGATLLPASAFGQSTASGGVEVSRAEIRRGLDWSQGRLAFSADGSAMAGPLDVAVRVTTIRGSARHGRSDGVVDLTLGTGWDLGDIRLHLGATGHLFIDAKAPMDYFEAGASLVYGYGPVQLTGGALLAPSQNAIGGSNLYTFAEADVGIPRTSFSIIAQIGHSSGYADDTARAQRLRPDENYTNWRIAIERRRNRLILGIEYIGTNVDRSSVYNQIGNKSDAGDRIIGRARFVLR